MEGKLEHDIKKISPLKGAELKKHLKKLDGWREIEEKHIFKDYTFMNFEDGLEFVNKVAALCEEYGHHPRVCLDYDSVMVMFTTHSIDAISTNDIIMAQKIEKIHKENKKKKEF